MSDTDTAIDVWLRIGDDDQSDFDPLPDSHGRRYPAEANTYPTETGYRVEWYLTAVGLVTAVHFDTLSKAYAWLEREGFENYSS